MNADERVKHHASDRTGRIVSEQRRFRTEGYWIAWDGYPRPTWHPAKSIERLRSIGATGQCEVTEEWTRLPGTDVEIRLRPPMRSGYVGYRQRWSS